VRLLFLGTPDFAAGILDALLRSRHSVAAVVTQPSRPRGRGLKVEPPAAARRAREAGIPLLQPERLHAPEVLECLRAYEPELVITAAFGRILRPSLLTLPKRGCWNVHASLLPRHRGASPVSAALLLGDSWTGISIFQMEEGLDTGPIVHQEMTWVEPRETAGELTDRLALLGGRAVLAAIEAEESHGVRRFPQPPYGATYAPLLSKDDGRISWNRPVEQVDRCVRALTPWPGAFTSLGGARLRVHRAVPVHRVSTGDVPGTIVSLEGGICVACRPGVILLQEVQSDGRKRQEATEWLRGNRVSAGIRLDPL
jgi:methionyl-tRNA formyltransferase